MKKVLFIFILFMVPSIVFGEEYCINVPRCNTTTGEDSYTKRCFNVPDVINVAMQVSTNTTNVGDMYSLVADSGDVVESIDFLIPDVPGYIFNGYYYNGDRIQDTKEITGVSYERSVVYGSTCVVDSEGNVESHRRSMSVPNGYNEVVLTSKWISTDMKVIYNLNGGTGASTGVASGENNEVKLSKPTKNGYIFTGWYYDEALTKKVQSDYIIELEFQVERGMSYGPNSGIISDYKDLNLYAGWETVDEIEEEYFCPTGVATAVINYHTNGGNDIVSSSIGALPNSSDTNLPLPIKAGYIFDGWYYDEALTNKVTTTLIREVKYEKLTDEKGCTKTATVNLYAKWKDTDSKNDALDGEENSGTSGDSSSGNDDSSDGTVNSGDDEINDSKNPNTGAFATGLSVIMLLGIGLFILYKKHYKYNKFPKI